MRSDYIAFSFAFFLDCGYFRYGFSHRIECTRRNSRHNACSTVFQVKITCVYYVVFGAAYKRITACAVSMQIYKSRRNVFTRKIVTFFASDIDSLFFKKAVYKPVFDIYTPRF